MADTTVYTIFAGMLPTLGFNKSDFVTDRKGSWQRNKVRGSSLGIRGVIGSDGSLRKARIKGSVAWYEYSTTVRAIHQEVLKNDAQTELQMPNKEWQKFSAGGRSLYNDFLQNMGINDMGPTGESVIGGKGTPSEQEVTANVEHADDSELRKQGRLVGLANAVDLYFKAKDGKIYRLDVTSMTMDDDRAHHGLTSYQDRLNKGVTSSQIMQLVDGGQFDEAQNRLLSYFQETQEGWNDVIRRLKDHIRGSQTQAANFLSRLESDNNRTSLGNQNVLKGLQNALAKKGGQDLLSQIRPAKNRAITRMRKNSSNRLGTGAKAEAFQSAVGFALHSIGNIIETFASNSARKGTYSTEIRLGDIGTNYTIEVKHQVIGSGARVLEFMNLKQGDVILHNEAALQHVYQRDMIQLDREGQNAILDLQSIRANQMAMAAGLMHDGTGVDIGGVTSTILSGLAKDGQNVYQRATAVISPQKFNKDIENWIQTTGTGQGFRKKVGSLLKRHIKKYGQIEGYEQQRTTAELAAGVTLAGTKKGVYWGLSKYLGQEIKDTFDDKVNPHWWAAPYISLLYPSGQVGSATN